jgi:outer membrane protein assembly factor BamB
MMNRLQNAIFCVAGFFMAVSATGQTTDIVQWRGPDRTGIYPDKGLLKVWPIEGLTEYVRLSGSGTGNSSPVLYNGKIYISGRKDSLEYISCFSLTGELYWQKVFGKAWYKSYPDSRSSPTIEDGKIFLISGSGEVACHDAETGDRIWRVDADSLYDGEIWIHGVSESPLLTETGVIYTTGGDENSMIALDKDSGNLLWKSKSLGGARGYASHILITHNEIPMIIAQTSRHAMGVNPEDGDILWSHDLFQYHVNEMGQGNNINSPFYLDGKVFITSGYDHPGILFELSDDGRSVDILWMSYDIDVHLGGFILADGNLYASNWENNRLGKWVCVDWNTGELNWEQDWYCKGSIIMAENLLYIYEEKSGHAGLLNPNPEKFDLISEFQMKGGAGPHWAHPAIYEGILYLRHGDLVIGYDLNAKNYE